MQRHPTSALLPGKSHGQRSLVGCSPWGRKESETTERLHFHFSLSCIGERNGNPLQCSCLENPRDGGAWWAAVYGVAQSRTWLKRLSSGSSSRTQCILNVPLCESYFKNGGTQSICRLSFLLSCICKHVKHLWFCTEISIKIPCWSFKNMRNMLSYCHPVVDWGLTPTDMFT